MIKCEQCNVNIINSLDVCPLCKNTLKLTSHETMDSPTIYPKILNIKKSNIILSILFIISVIVSVLCIVINLVVDSSVLWSVVCIGGIIYCWATTLYSIKNNVNIGSLILLQAVLISILSIVIDVFTKYNSWSFNYSIPIIIMTSNLTVFILLLVTQNKLVKYIIYQFILSLFCFVPIIFYKIGLSTNLFLTMLCILVTVILFIITIILFGKPLKEELYRRFHF